MQNIGEMVRILTALLLVLLTACGTARLEPSSQLVQRALALQLEQTQQQLEQERQLKEELLNRLREREINLEDL